MFKSKAITLAGVLLVALSSTIHAQEWVITNGSVQLEKADLKGIVQALLLSGQISKDKLSVAHVDKAAKDYVLYKSLELEAKKAKLADRADVQTLLDLTRLQMLSTIYLKQYVENVKLDDFEAAAREEYALNKKKFKQPESVHAQHILIEIKDDEQAAKALALDVRAKALAGNESFAELAEKYSADASAKNNKGDLGFFSKGRMVPEFEQKVFALKVGDISEPVKTQFGFHIIKLINKREEKTLTFDEVKTDMIANLENQARRKIFSDKMYNTLMTPEFKVNDDAFEDIIKEILHN